MEAWTMRELSTGRVWFCPEIAGSQPHGSALGLRAGPSRGPGHRGHIPELWRWARGLPWQGAWGSAAGTSQM